MSVYEIPPTSMLHMYLTEGDAIQKRADTVLRRLSIIELLSEFQATLVGSLPVGIHSRSSDIDIICHSAQINEIAFIINQHFSHLPGYHTKIKNFYGQSTWIACFRCGHMPVEIMAQNLPVQEHLAFREMKLAQRLLAISNPQFKEDLILEKKSGNSTSEAFAKLLEVEVSNLPLIEKLESISFYELGDFLPVVYQKNNVVNPF